MDIDILENNNGASIAEIANDDVVITTAQDALDLIMGPGIPFPKKIILQRQNIAEAFYDLSSGLAGDVMQKFVTYNAQVAIVGDFSDLSEHFHSLVLESNRGSDIGFVGTTQEAIDFLSRD